MNRISTTNRYGLTQSHLKGWLQSRDYSQHHLKSLTHYTHRLYAPAKTSSTTLGKALVEDFEKSFSSDEASLKHATASSHDHTVKCVVSLEPGDEVEMVILGEKNRITLCLSTQVGCGQGCGFCATGKMGLLRNLKAHEIMQQLRAAELWIRSHSSWREKLTASWNNPPQNPSRWISNIVFMGMGEPCDNVAAVKQALEILLDPWALGFTAKRITLSTAGHLEGLRSFYQDFPQISYALSLHLSDPLKRKALMPIEKRFPLEKVLRFLREKSNKHHKTFMIQYTLIKGVNDQKQHAEELSQLLEGIKVKINLLFLNPIPSFRYQSTEKDQIFSFAETLRKKGLRVMVRFSKGEDIQGACGQLTRINSCAH